MALCRDGGSAEEPCPARLYPTSARWLPLKAQPATVSRSWQARTVRLTAAIREDRLTSTPAVSFAQIAAVHDPPTDVRTPTRDPRQARPIVVADRADSH